MKDSEIQALIDDKDKVFVSFRMPKSLYDTVMKAGRAKYEVLPSYFFKPAVFFYFLARGVLSWLEENKR